MSVSAPTPNQDSALLVEGGEAFLRRLAELKDATEAHTAALADLELGKAAKAAYEDSQRVLESAKQKRDAELAHLAVELKEARDQLDKWVLRTKQELGAQLHDAQEKQKSVSDALATAEVAQASAQALSAQAATELAEARQEAQQVLSDSEARASELMASATDKAADILAKARAEESALLAEASQLKAEHAQAKDLAEVLAAELKRRLAAVAVAAKG